MGLRLIDDDDDKMIVGQCFSDDSPDVHEMIAKKVAIIFQSEQKIELKKSSKLVNIQSIFTEHSVMMGEK